eukprot:TRINITY_DN38671_c0_g1_i1.p1 TRINITY_DN38671_c0_g1~~TRINITY_DN38671_c0_g1_i1.p1  ORF type:complete len:112 (+),score=5.23 TRINITY_DN38671_c0_g1_i1:185-520(+)
MRVHRFFSSTASAHWSQHAQSPTSSINQFAGHRPDYSWPPRPGHLDGCIGMAKNELVKCLRAVEKSETRHAWEAMVAGGDISMVFKSSASCRNACFTPDEERACLMGNLQV